MSKILQNLKAAVKRMKQNTTALYYAYKSESTPILAKIISGITIAYLLSPIDLIPDFIPVLGMLDDLIIVPLLIILAIRLIPPAVWQESKLKAESSPITLSKKNWSFAVFIILIWIIAIYFSYSFIFN